MGRSEVTWARSSSVATTSFTSGAWLKKSPTWTDVVPSKQQQIADMEAGAAAGAAAIAAAPAAGVAASACARSA
eukprot:CAMPEP_0172685750 /NCGR_PEP_ID=MMETSP1074-20121228/20461_1 /TAXON_ID=2916 /ORGANISM="Ceratium fusus, Strain PA161109" /LENGTH=73 /DNA_ID=CAMNT_0013504949 /DNA_START=1 /DNA_END=223 /DNA_ORIENTATION=-